MARKHETPEWTPDLLVQAVRAGTPQEKVDVLKRIGLLTTDGKPTKSAEAWGNQPSRTPVLDAAPQRSPTSPRPRKKDPAQ